MVNKDGDVTATHYLKPVVSNALIILGMECGCYYISMFVRSGCTTCLPQLRFKFQIIILDTIIIEHVT